MKFYLAIFVILSTSYGIAQAEKEPSYLERKLDSIIIATMKSEHIPGLSYIVVKKGNTLLKKGYGFTTLGENVNYVHPDSTIFRIGSITKTFTALALLQQVDQGKIELNENVNKYLSSIQVPE